MDSNEKIAFKKELLFTTGSRGYSYIQDMANQVLGRMAAAAINEDDDVRGASLRREAKAAQKFWTDLTQAITENTQLDLTPETTEPEDEDDGMESFYVDPTVQ